jgi:uncharacterized protein (DUF1684 family)
VTTARQALDLLDWRERTHELYRTVRTHGEPAVAHALWREGRDQLLGQHPASPLRPEHRDGFEGLVVADYDERYRFVVPLLDAEPQALAVETGTDGTVTFERVGRVVLPVPDAEIGLDVWRLTSYGGGLFVPLRDGTCDTSAYGGGRYLIDTVKGADLGGDLDEGTLVVDLNFAYNPSCAYDPAWACPLAPAGNTTTVPVPVGEQHAGPWVE